MHVLFSFLTSHPFLIFTYRSSYMVTGEIHTMATILCSTSSTCYFTALLFSTYYKHHMIILNDTHHSLFLTAYNFP